ncbi:MAG: AgmX/PglI C-terminal domain-containing protein [Deltaproteobacteria bacterium]|nr:AgmX/PglI C-terminal domain-containing protein [Deltaproteobacteria bacterium]
MNATWLLGLCLLAAPAQDAPAGQEHVLVWKNAWLHAAPKDSAPSFRELGFADRARADHPEELRVFLLLGVKGAWAEIETVRDRELAHCQETLFDLADYRLRLFVRTRDLAPVLAAPVELRYEDGTALRLKPGIPALLQYPEADSPHRLAHDGLRFAVRLPPGSVGQSYRPAGRFAYRCEDRLRTVESRLRFDGSNQVESGRIRLCVEDVKPERTGVALTLHTPCAEMRLRADPPPPKTSLFTLRGAGGISREGSGPWLELARGSRVLWPDGSQAGTVRETIWLRPDRIEAGERPCVTKTLLASRRDAEHPDRGSLKLCFRPQDLKRREPFDGSKCGLVNKAATVSTGKPLVKGSLSRQRVHRIVRAQLGRVRACYQCALEEQPGLRGELRVRFVVRPEGDVSHADVRSSGLGNPALELCVLDVVRSLRFPPCGGGIMEVESTFRFRTD